MDPYIQRLLQEAEWKAEKLTSYLRLVVMAVLMVLFLLQRHELPLTARAFWLLPVSFGVILGIAVVSSQRQWFRPWMPYVTTTFDVALVLVPLVSNLLANQLSLRFVMCVGPVWLMCPILAYTALRYRPLLAIYATSLFVVGLLVLVVPEWPRQNLLQGPSLIKTLDSYFTREANFLRLAMISSTAVVLGFAVFRSRRTLLRAIEETQRKANLARYFDSHLAETLAQNGIEDLRQGRHQMAAILFADIQGYTALAENLAPAELTRLWPFLSGPGGI